MLWYNCGGETFQGPNGPSISRITVAVQNYRTFTVIYGPTVACRSVVLQFCRAKSSFQHCVNSEYSVAYGHGLFFTVF